MIPPFRVSLLGGFSLVVGETSLTLIPRIQSLLAYLALHRAAPQARSHLAFLLWPDSEEAQAHTNLRQLLYHLRQSLPHASQLVAVSRQSLRWQPASELTITLDVEEFEQALKRAEQMGVRQALGQAVHLYRGDLFPNCYDEWIFPERDRLHQLFLQAAERLIALLEQERDYFAAITVAQHLLRLDSLHEAAYRQLMRLHALCGDRAAALRVYHSCASRLERDLGTVPGEATRQIYELLMRKDLTPERVQDPSAPQGRAPLIGRRTQWQQLQAIWHEARDGHPHLVLLSGEAGMGKTRLAEEMEAWVSRQGLVTASARCYAAEGHLPYAPVKAWLRTETIYTGLLTLDSIYLTEIARLLPELRAQRPDVLLPTKLTQGWQRQGFFEAMARALLSARQPLLLFLDDVQWCDAETLQWLHYLFRFAPQSRLLMLGTVRAEEMLPGHTLVNSLSSWQPGDLVRELALEPLASSETITLAEQVAGHALDAAMINTLHAETEGNPLFVIETVRAASTQLQKQASQSLLTQPASTLPPAIQHVLVARLAQLSSEAREIVKLAAVIGREFSFTILSHLSDQPEEILVRSLDELWQRRIVREQGADAYDFSHEKLREQVYISLSTTRRRFLHRRVAEALETVYRGTLDAVSPRIARHYEQAGLPERAVPYYLQAGKQAGQVYAHEEALDALQHAATLLEAHAQSEQPWQVMMAIYEEQGNILEMIGKHREAERVYQQANNVIPAQEALIRARLRRKIAATLDYPPHLADADHAYREAKRLLERVAQKNEQEWRDEWLHSHLGHLQVFFLLGAWQEMTAIIEQVQPFIEQQATATQRTTFFTQIAMRDAVRDRYVCGAETRSACQTGLRAALKTGNPQLIGTTRFVLGYCLFLSDQLKQADQELQAAQAMGEQVGDAELVARCRLHFLPLVWRRLGQVEAVRRTIEYALARGERRYSAIFSAQQAWIAWRDGKLELAEAAGQAAVEAWQRQRPVYPFQWTGLWPLIAIAANSEHPAVVIDMIHQLLAPTQQRLPESLLHILEEIVQAGEGEQVHVLLKRAIQLAQEMGYL
jgi:DNA-binding SARP family transcriptional activator